MTIRLSVLPGRDTTVFVPSRERGWGKEYQPRRPTVRRCRVEELAEDDAG